MGNEIHHLTSQKWHKILAVVARNDVKWTGRTADWNGRLKARNPRWRGIAAVYFQLNLYHVNWPRKLSLRELWTALWMTLLTTRLYLSRRINHDGLAEFSAPQSNSTHVNWDRSAARKNKIFRRNHLSVNKWHVCSITFLFLNFDVPRWWTERACEENLSLLYLHLLSRHCRIKKLIWLWKCSEKCPRCFFFANILIVIDRFKLD